MSSITLVRDMHAWLRWLTARTLTAAEALSSEEFRREFPIGLGSVHATLVHLLGAEQVWIGAIEGVAPGVAMPSPGDLPDVASIRAGLAAVRRRWDARLDALDEQELARLIVRVRDGREHRQTVGDAMLQVPTHALYHTAQVSFMFRSMGRSLPDSSWIIFARERLAARSS